MSLDILGIITSFMNGISSLVSVILVVANVVAKIIAFVPEIRALFGLI